MNRISCEISNWEFRRAKDLSNIPNHCSFIFNNTHHSHPILIIKYPIIKFEKGSNLTWGQGLLGALVHCGLGRSSRFMMRYNCDKWMSLCNLYKWTSNYENNFLALGKKVIIILFKTWMPHACNIPAKSFVDDVIILVISLLWGQPPYVFQWS